MKAYPVRISRPSYRGSDPRKRAKLLEAHRVADRIETYLNSDLANLPNNSLKVYFSHSVARDLREDEKSVSDLIYATDCGSGGITIVKGSFDKAMANRARPPGDWDHS